MLVSVFMAPQLSYIPLTTASAPKARVGSWVCGKWRLDALLGSGGMGAVYAASHRNGARGAIKIFHTELSAFEDVREHFLDEGYAANKVPHSGVVSVLDDGELDSGEPYLVMELLEGETVHDRCVHRGAMLADPAMALDIAYEVLDILIATHDSGIVHCDIKPQNIFLTLEGDVKLLDFGIARMAEAPVFSRSAVGTPAFMSPEQASGEPANIDARADLWATAATLFWMLGGQHVHQAHGDEDEVVLARSQRARSIAEDAPGLPPALIALVDRGLAFDPDERFDDARAMQQAVRWTSAEVHRNLPTQMPQAHSMVSLGPAVVLAETPTPVTIDLSLPKGTPRKWSLYVAALLAICAGGAGLYRNSATFSIYQHASRASPVTVPVSHPPKDAPERQGRAPEMKLQNSSHGAFRAATSELSSEARERPIQATDSLNPSSNDPASRPESKSQTARSRSGVSLSAGEFIP